MKLPGRGQPDEDKKRPDPSRSSRGPGREESNKSGGWLNRSPGSDRPGARGSDEDDFGYARDRYGSQRRGEDSPPDRNRGRDEGTSSNRFGSSAWRGGDAPSDKGKGKDEGSSGRFGGLMRRGGDDEEKKSDADESRGRLGSRLGDLSGSKPGETRAQPTGRFGGSPGRESKPGDTRSGSGGRSSSGSSKDKGKDKDDKSGGGLMGRFSRGKKDDEKRDDTSSRRGSSGTPPIPARRSPFLRGTDDDDDRRDEPGGSSLRSTGGLARTGPLGSRDRSTPIGADDDDRSSTRTGGYGSPGSARPGYGRDRDEQPGGARPGIGRDREDTPGLGRPGYGRDRDEQPGGARPGYGRDRDEQPGGARPGFGRDREETPGLGRPGYGRDRDEETGGTRGSPPRDRDQFGATSRTSPYGDRAQPGITRGGPQRDQPDSSTVRPPGSSARDREEPGSTLRDRGTYGSPASRLGTGTTDRDTTDRDRQAGAPRSASQTRSFTTPTTPERRSPFGAPTDRDKDRDKGRKDDDQKSGGLLGRFSSRGKKEDEKQSGKRTEPPDRTGFGAGRSASGTTGTLSSTSSTARRSQTGTAISPPTTGPARRSQTMQPAKVEDKGRRGAQKPAEKPKARAASRGVKASPLPDAKARGALTVHQGLDFERKIDLVGVVLLCFAGIAFAAVLPSVSFGLLAEPETGWTGSLNHVLSQMFGWGKIVWPVVAAAVGIWLMKAHFADSGFELDYFRVIGLISLYACALTWLQMVELIDNTAPTIEAFKPISRDLAIEQGRGGGWLGHQLYLFLLSQFLDVGALSVLIAWLVVSLMLSFDLSVVELWGYAAGAILFLRPNPEARARRKAAQEARTADIVAAMRPNETSPPVSAAAAVAATAVPTKTQEAPAVVEPERRRFGLKRGGTEEATPAPTPVPAPAADQSSARPSAPLIRRGTETAAVTSTETETDKPAALPATDERTDQESRVPERRRMPHLSRTQELAETSEEKTPGPAAAEAGQGEDKSSQGRLGFLRRRGETETSEKPDVTQAADPAAESTPRATVPDIPVPPRRAMEGPAGSEGPGRATPERPAGTASASGQEAKPSEEKSDQADAAGRARRFMPGLRRSEPRADESAAGDGEKKPADIKPEVRQTGSVQPGVEGSSPFARPAPKEDTGAPGGDGPEDRSQPFRRPAPVAEDKPDQGKTASGDGDQDRPGTPGTLAAGIRTPEREDGDELDELLPGMDRPGGPRPRPFERTDRPRPTDSRPGREEIHDESVPLAADSLARPRRVSPFSTVDDEESPGASPETRNRLAAGDSSRPGRVPPSEVELPARPDAPQRSRPLPVENAPAAQLEKTGADKAESAPSETEKTAEPPARPRGLDFLRRTPPNRPAAPTEAVSPDGETARAEPPATETPAPAVKDKETTAPAGAERRSPPPREGTAGEPTVRPAGSPAASQGAVSAAPQRTIPATPPRPAPQPAGPVASQAAPAEQAAPVTPRTPPAEAPQRPAPAAPTIVPPRRPPPEPTAAVASGPNAPEARFGAPPKGKFQPPDFTKLLRKGDERHISDEILLDKARVIEDTLVSFGAPGKVVEVNPGPVITQFGVEPSYLESRGGKRTRVKVGSIARLDADLALALAARSIRIEAPVPGKGYVGIEVPNDEVALVGLLDIMESQEFKRIDSKLRIALGLAVDGSPVAADLTAMPHLLIAGTTGSGKSVCVNAIITCLLLQNSPEDVQFIMVDPKRVELTGYNGIPHLVAPVVVDLERIVGVLQWVQREMEERYRKFSAIAARNILDYNNKLEPGTPRMPYYVVVVDELADLMMLAPDETERLLARLAQMARATGIHLVISTQRPSVDIITGLIKANFPARIAFAVASSVDSRVILDQPGAEKLLGRGDMLYQSPDAAAPLRMQGVFVSDEEIMAITRYWRGSLGDQPVYPEREITLGAPGSRRDIPVNRMPPPVVAEDTSVRRSSKPGQPNLWEAGSEGDEEEDFTGEDELYDQAVDLVERLSKASISLLQRRLRIGYTRAARLIDRMESEGIVGPSTEGSKPREVLKRKGAVTDEDEEE